jgi:hypothetical protein
VFLGWQEHVFDERLPVGVEEPDMSAILTQSAVFAPRSLSWVIEAVVSLVRVLVRTRLASERLVSSRLRCLDLRRRAHAGGRTSAGAQLALGMQCVGSWGRGGREQGQRRGERARPSDRRARGGGGLREDICV